MIWIVLIAIVVWLIILSIRSKITKKNNSIEIAGQFYNWHGDEYEWYWQSFIHPQITDWVDGYVKINGKWISKENVIYYDEIDPFKNALKKAKKKIENKVNKKEDK